MSYHGFHHIHVLIHINIRGIEQMWIGSDGIDSRIHSKHLGRISMADTDSGKERVARGSLLFDAIEITHPQRIAIGFICKVSSANQHRALRMQQARRRKERKQKKK